MLGAALLLALAASAIAPRVWAQMDATQWRSGSVDMDRGWRAQDGDNLAWAQANFDDSGWKQVELDDLGAAQPGWQWYRLRVQLPPEHGHLHLLIAGGPGTYEVYVNGQKQAGPKISSTFAVKRPTERVIPLSGVGSELEIALRTHAPVIYTTWHLPLFLTVAVGTPGAIDNERAAMQSQRLYSALPSIAMNLVVILAGFGAFALYRSQQRHTEYLWLGLYLTLLGTSYLVLGCTMSGISPLALNSFLADPLVYVFTIMQIQFTFAFAGKPISRLWRGYEGLLLAPLLLVGLVSAAVVPSYLYLAVEGLIVLPAALLLPALLLLWYRGGNREAGWLILPSLLPLATNSLQNLGTASLYFGWGFADFLQNPIPAGPISLQPTDLGDFLFVLAIGVVMFFRFTRVSREQARAAAELEAARAIQERLVPAHLPPVAGYAIEAAYFPAAEVGGDFYQVLEVSAESALLVVGDVSGKGLKGAMTATLAMGALRALASEGLEPADMLMRLNRQLTETNDEGFVTCLCARIDRDGEVTLANAGHLVPYHNGEEVMVQPGLPLGIVAETLYEERTVRLQPGDRLTLMSDGVVEAQNARGELFGFERTQALSREPADAIAAAARRFGQADDITVLTLTRMADEAVRTELGAAADAPA
jgi:hypothetical protein